MKKTALVGMLMAVMIFGGCSNPFQVDDPNVTLNTEKGKFRVVVEIADTPELRKRGLMFRQTLANDKGMFFVFDKEQSASFWMKNTLIPLDIVFIDANYKVINIAKNVPPCEVKNCPVYRSARNAQYVLELNGGAADNYGLKAGDLIDVSKS